MVELTDEQDNQIEEYKEKAALIERVTGIFSRGEYSRVWYRFDIIYRGSKEPSRITTDYIKTYKDNHWTEEVPVVFLGIILTYRKVKKQEQEKILTDGELEKKKTELRSILKNKRDAILKCFDEDERELIDENTMIRMDNPLRKEATNFQLSGKCLPNEHAWGKWTNYSCHEQRKCYKCEEVEASGTDGNGNPVRQSYAASLSCGY